jgi:hypothetical protein
MQLARTPVWAYRVRPDLEAALIRTELRLLVARTPLFERTLAMTYLPNAIGYMVGPHPRHDARTVFGASPSELAAVVSALRSRPSAQPGDLSAAREADIQRLLEWLESRMNASPK